MIRLRVDVLALLREAGYSSYKLGRKGDRIFCEDAIQRFRHQGYVTMGELDKLCSLLNCQPGDLIAYESDNTQPQGEEKSAELP